MDPLTRGIIDVLLSEDDEHLAHWLLSLAPFSSSDFLDEHEEALFYGTGHHYICRDIGDMISHMSDSFERLADNRLSESLSRFGDEVRKAFAIRKPRPKTEKPIVKKHVIADSQADLDKERSTGEEPIEIEVETPKGETRFIKNTSSHSFENPAKIEIED